MKDHIIISKRFAPSTVWLLAMLLVFFLATPSWAGMKMLNDNQLSNVYAEGFSSFTITPGAGGTSDVTALFNIYTSSYITIDSMKMGYYNDGTTTGWDEDWTNLQIGGPTRSSLAYNGLSTPNQDFQTQGAYMKANFTNLNNAPTRTLNSITLGVTSATGNISALFNSFSGSVLGGGSGNPDITNAHRIPDLNLAAGVHTITANNTPVSITLSLTNGYQINFGAGSSYQ